MAGKKPLFASAPRMIIGIRDSDANFIKIAYAIGLSVNISTTVQPIYVIGDYGPVSYEPTQYQPVTGSFQIVRLQSQAAKDNKLKNAGVLYNGSKINPGTLTSSINEVDNNILSQSLLHEHLDPAKVLVSKSFDIDIYMNVTGYGHAIKSLDVQVFADSRVQPPENKIVKFFTIKDCRIISRNINIAQGQMINEPLNFMGLLGIQRNEQLDSVIQEKAI